MSKTSIKEQERVRAITFAIALALRPVSIGLGIELCFWLKELDHS